MSDPGSRDVFRDIVLTDGEVVAILGANASVPNAFGRGGPLTTFCQTPTLRAIPAGGDERAFGYAAG